MFAKEQINLYPFAIATQN